MTVSIIIPTYNRPALLSRAVASALTACPPDGEVIVIDDRSDTADTALRDVTDPRLRITTNTGDKGAAGARNHGIAMATGDIVMFLDDDDVMVADYPARVIKAARESVADFGFARAGLSEAPDVPWDGATTISSAISKSGLVPASVPLRQRMPGFGYGFWARRAVLQNVGSIRIDQVVDEDTDYYCRLYANGHQAWFESDPGCIVSRDYPVAQGTAGQITVGTDPRIRAECQLRTYQRNHEYFGLRSADRWSLIRYTLRNLAFSGLDDLAKGMIRDLDPLDWRIRAWLFWQMKKRGRKIRARRVARKLARS